ncbi:MAG: RIP metalloprotease RseP [Candidatus Zixiibacteriota bacterium]
MLLTIVSFIFVLGILIFIHELGHFLVAKKVGIKVEKFSLGFPPNIFSKQVGETTYCIGVIPLGGFVKMTGENPDDEASGAPYEFMSKTIVQRAAVIFAGPFMNYVLAIALLIGIFLFGGRPLFDDTRVLVGTVAKDSPASQAGLAEGDQIIMADGAVVNNFDSLRTRINSHLATPIELAWLRSGDTIRAAITTKVEEVPNIEGGVDSIGIIGFTQKVLGYQSYGVVESIQRGFVTTHVIVWETIKFVKKAISGQVSAKMIGGPLFIAQQSGKEAEKGASSLFFFMALLSVNLAVLNVLPIPILDGGHLLFLLIEKIRGVPLSIRARALAQQVGIIFLFGLIIFVTYNDVLRIIRGF